MLVFMASRLTDACVTYNDTHAVIAKHFVDEDDFEAAAAESMPGVPIREVEQDGVRGRMVSCDHGTWRMNLVWWDRSSIAA